MAGVQHAFDRFDTMALFALCNVGAREHQVVHDGVSAGPLFEQVVAFEKRVMAVRRMGNHQCLHGQRVFVHQVGDTRV